MNSQRDELYLRRNKELEKINSKFTVFREKLESNHKTEMHMKRKELKNFNASSNILLQEALNSI